MKNGQKHFKSPLVFTLQDVSSLFVWPYANTLRERGKYFLNKIYFNLKSTYNV